MAVLCVLESMKVNLFLILKLHKHMGKFLLKRVTDIASSLTAKLEKLFNSQELSVFGEFREHISVTLEYYRHSIG